jgi:Endosomal/lysosomal potassium channel TMEM175
MIPILSRTPREEAIAIVPILEAQIEVCSAMLSHSGAAGPLCSAQLLLSCTLTQAANQTTSSPYLKRRGHVNTMGSGAEGHTFKPERMLAFSDAVMAVAITLLVLDLKLPSEVSDADLGNALRAAVPNSQPMV